MKFISAMKFSSFFSPIALVSIPLSVSEGISAAFLHSREQFKVRFFHPLVDLKYFTYQLFMMNNE
jgi:ABC-type sulfate transport system permease subunit